MELYKYVIPERIDVAASGRLRFSQATALNDPFELRPFFETLIPERKLLAEIPGKLAYSDLLTPRGQTALLETIAGVFDTLRDTAPQVRNTMYDALGTRVGILSLSRAPDHPLMWAHYAAEHRGMVLVFDSSHAWFDRRRGPADEFFHLRDVRYRSPRPVESILSLDGNDVFFAKSEHWSYEQELRMIVPLDSADHVIAGSAGPICLFNFPAEALTAVIVGAKAEPDLRRRLDGLASASPWQHLSIRESRLDIREQRVVIEPAMR